MWHVVLPPWMVTTAGGLKPMIDSFERQAREGRLPPGCVGFEIVSDYGAPFSRYVYTCEHARRED